MCSGTACKSLAERTSRMAGEVFYANRTNSMWLVDWSLTSPLVAEHMDISAIASNADPGDNPLLFERNVSFKPWSHRAATSCDGWHRRFIKFPPTRLRYCNLSFVVTLDTMDLRRIGNVCGIVGKSYDSRTIVIRWHYYDCLVRS